MAKRKGPSGQQLREIRSSLAELKRKGLWSGDARKAKGGWRQKQTLKEFGDVLKGKAQVVKVDRKTAKEMQKHSRNTVGGVRSKIVGKKALAVVPVREPGERVKFSKKTGTLSSIVDMYGEKFRRIVPTKRVNRPEDLPDPPEGKKYYYGLISASGGGVRWESKEEFAAFIAEYKKKAKDADKFEDRIMSYVEILEPLDEDEE